LWLKGQIAEEVALTALEGEARLHFQAPIICGFEEAFAIGPASNLGSTHVFGLVGAHKSYKMA
jgi:hypothetical protein